MVTSAAGDCEAREQSEAGKAHSGSRGGGPTWRCNRRKERRIDLLERLLSGLEE